MTTGADPGWPSEPTTRDRLLYGIGRVCEIHVQLDIALAALAADLAIVASPSDPQAAYKHSPGMGANIAHCRKLLAESTLPEDLRTDGDGALEAARRANELRNRVVHDWWVERMGDAEASSLTRRHVVMETPGLIDELSDLAFVADAEHRVHRAYARVSSLATGISLADSAAGAPVPEGYGYKEMLPDIRGESDRSPNGEWRQHGVSGAT